MLAAAPPLEGLARTAALYGFALTAWLLATAALRRPVGLYQQAAAVVLWLGATAVALAHAIGVLSDGAGHQVPVTLAYAAVAAAVIPVLWPRASDLEEDAAADDGAVADDNVAADDDAVAVAVARPASGAGIAALATGVTVVLLLRLVAVW